mmetsp:Transcript_31570/g.54052  ORF Transcript_31570/g.54052 Transcript_31570/m.54052 type:complete len:186 (-) Transcript_31570:76-633(-)
MPAEEVISTKAAKPVGKEGSAFRGWTPVIYFFPWGPSVTRGCLFAWFFLTIPYIIFRNCCGAASSAIYSCFGNPPRGSGTAYIAMYVSWVPIIIFAIIWIIVTFILFFPWLFCYVIGFIVEFIVMIIYYGTCCCCSGEREKATWRAFSCSGWLGERNSDYDPFTKRVWQEWSPCHTLCDYNFPPV